MITSYLGKYSRTISPSSPCIRYVQLVCGGYQCATDKNIPSVSPEALKLSDDSSQSHVPFLLPAVSTCPGQFPTLKWKPVFSRGPKNVSDLMTLQFEDGLGVTCRRRHELYEEVLRGADDRIRKFTHAAKCAYYWTEFVFAVVDFYVVIGAVFLSCMQCRKFFQSETNTTVT